MVQLKLIIFYLLHLVHFNLQNHLIYYLNYKEDYQLELSLEALTSEDFKRILREPDFSLIKQYVALLKTENVDLEFSDDGIDAIANIASEVNATVENIGARRLHTIIEKILDEISFTATDRAGEKIIINKEYINKNLDNLVKDTDLSKFIL